MPEPAVLPALDTAIRDVLERMFFVEVVGDSVPPVSAALPAIEACLPFEGDPPGYFTLAVTTAAARPIAADFLGVDETEVTDQQVEAVVSELANMVCGSLLSQVESTATFRLGAPRILPAQDRPASLSGGTRRTVHSVEIAGGVVTASLTTESPACLANEKPGF